MLTFVYPSYQTVRKWYRYREGDQNGTVIDIDHLSTSLGPLFLQWREGGLCGSTGAAEGRDGYLEPKKAARVKVKEDFVSKEATSYDPTEPTK